MLTFEEKGIRIIIHLFPQKST